MENKIDLNEVANQTKFAEIVGISKQAISKQAIKGVLPSVGTYGEWLKIYCERLREEAAGRGGDDQVNLSKARAEEAIVKTARMRLDYNREIGAVVMGGDVEVALNDWARFTNRELLQGYHKLVSEIQSTYKINIAPELVEKIVIPTAERIKGHAEKLGRDFVEGVEQLHDTEDGTDSRID